MTTETARFDLVDSSLDLLQAIGNGLPHKLLAGKAENLCTAVEHPPSDRLVSTGPELLPHGWREEYRTNGTISWGLIGNIHDDPLAKSCHALFKKLAKFLLDSSNNNYLQREHAGELEAALCDYLSRRGLDVNDVKRLSVTEKIRPALRSRPAAICQWREKADTQCTSIRCYRVARQSGTTWPQ